MKQWESRLPSSYKQIISFYFSCLFSLSRRELRNILLCLTSKELERWLCQTTHLFSTVVKTDPIICTNKAFMVLLVKGSSQYTDLICLSCSNMFPANLVQATFQQVTHAHVHTSPANAKVWILFLCNKIYAKFSVSVPPPVHSIEQAVSTLWNPSQHWARRSQSPPLGEHSSMVSKTIMGPTSRTSPSIWPRPLMCSYGLEREPVMEWTFLE